MYSRELNSKHQLGGMPSNSSASRNPSASYGMALSPAHIIQMQKIYGNRAMMGILQKMSVRSQPVIQRMKGQIVKQDRGFAIKDIEDRKTYVFNSKCYRWLDEAFVGLVVDYELDGKDQAMAEFPKHVQESIEAFKENYDDSAGGAENGQQARDLVAYGHIVSTDEEEDKSHHAGHIKNGLFTSKKDERGIVNINEGKLKGLLKEIDTFYELTDELKETYQSGFSNDFSLTLYRAVATHVKGNQKELVEVLPASTSFSIDFVKEWTKNRGKENYVIFEITVPITHGMLIMSYPPNYKDLKYPKSINPDQMEVTLAPSKFTVLNRRMDKGFQIVQVRAEQLDKEDAKESVTNQVKTYGQDISNEHMNTAFRQFKTALSMKNIMRNYLKDFHDLEKKFFTYKVLQENETSKKVELGYEQSIHFIQMEVEYDSDAHEISVFYSKNGEETLHADFTKKNIGTIFYSLPRGNISNASALEQLDTPIQWYEMRELLAEREKLYAELENSVLLAGSSRKNKKRNEYRKMLRETQQRVSKRLKEIKEALQELRVQKEIDYDYSDD